MSLEKHAAGTLTANGTEQMVTEIIEPSRFSGYISLAKMETGDTIVIRQYVRLLNGAYERYASETYSGVQDNPVLYFTPKEIASALRITLQQTAGTFKTFDYLFLKERKPAPAVQVIVESPASKATFQA